MAWSLSVTIFSGSGALGSWVSLPVVSLLGAMLLCTGCAWFVLHRIFSRRLQSQKIELDFRDHAIENHCILSVTDPEGRYIRVNQKFLATFGYSEDEVLGQTRDLLAFDDRQQEQDSWAHVQRSEQDRLLGTTRRGDPWTGEEVLRRADGQRVVTLATVIPQFDRKGVHRRNICLHTDITRQKLSEAQRQLCQVLDDLQDEVFIFEVATLQIRYMNKAALARFGWTLAEATAKQISATDRNFDVGLFRRHTAPLFTGEREVVSIEAQHRSSDIEISTRLHRDGSGERMFLSVLRDISARRKIEKAKMETVAQVSHELRSPLTSIKGALGLVLSGKLGDLPPELHKLVDIANRNGEHLLSMVDDILDLERMNSGKMALQLQREDMAELVEDARILNSTLGQNEGISIEVRSGGGPFPVLCDRKRVSQVITNLLSNAVKYSPPDGVVEVAVERNGESVRVAISDTGPGIPAADLPNLFKNFSRVASGDGRKRKGTGLGLAISKKIITIHHGKINIRSIEGEGTTLYFDLPLLEGANKPAVATLPTVGTIASQVNSGPQDQPADEQKETTACQT